MKIPQPLDMKNIYSDTYLFYTNWNAVKGEPNWKEMLDEAREMYAKHPYEICKKILNENISIIEKSHMERSKVNA